MRVFDASTVTASGEDITRPYFLVYMGFATPSRLSTTDNVSWGGYTWLASSMTVRMGNNPVLQIFNEDTLLGKVVLADGTAGRSVKIYQGYQNDSAHINPDLIFDGEMGQASVGSTVSITCKRFAPSRSPRHYCVPPVFNYIPTAGTRINTPGGVFVLESR